MKYSLVKLITGGVDDNPVHGPSCCYKHDRDTQNDIEDIDSEG